LLKYGADPEATMKRNDKDSVARFLLFQGDEIDFEIIELLLDKGCVDNKAIKEYELLLNAINNSSIEYLKKLLDYGFNVDARENEFSETPLLHVLHDIGDEKKEIIELLIKYGAKADYKVYYNYFNDETGKLEVDEEYGDETALTRILDNNFEDGDPYCLDLLATMLKLGADPKTKDDDGETPLFAVSRYMGKKGIELFLKYGADINAKNDDGFTILDQAVFWEDLEKIRFLMEKGADLSIENPETKRFMKALIFEEYRKADAALKNGADIDFKYMNGYRPFSIILGIYDESVNRKLQYLMDRGVDINYQHKSLMPYPFNPLERASENCYIDENIILRMIQKGADTVKKDDRFDVLYSNLLNLRENVIDVLIKKGYDINHRRSIDGCDWKLNLMENYFSSTQNSLKVIKLMIENGFDLDAASREKNYWFHIFSRREFNKENIKIMDYLVEKGYDINEKGTDGETPIMYATTNSRSDDPNLFIRHFLKYRPDINMQDDNGKTALMYAVEKAKKTSTVKILLENSSDISIKDKSGKTALDYAKERKNEDLTKLLTDYQNRKK